MYQDLYDEKHKMYVFNPIKKAQEKGHVKRPSSGEYEGGILCADCDNVLLGEFETYASKAIYGGALPAKECPTSENCINQHGVKFTKCENIDYAKFKLFLLSILWRASISSRPLFNDIDLGEHEEPIRKMILDRNPGEVSDYPIIFMTYLNDKSMFKDLVAHPQRRESKSGHTIFVFIIGGMFYQFYMNNPKLKYPDYVLTETIKPTNNLNIFHIPIGEGMDVILKYYGIHKPSH